MFLSIICILIFLYFLYNGAELLLLGCRTRSLESIIPLQTNPLPSVSIIVAACNEEKHLLSAATTIQRIDYPNKEIILVNDRSTDNTGKIIDQLSRQDSSIKAVHVKTLPSGWMGKNFALYQGSKYATGDWLLFTDADVYFDQNTLKHAISYALENELDHLAIMPMVEKATKCFNIMMLFITTLYFLMGKPWRARYSWSKRSVGQGSFNLINAAIYKKIGRHEKISLNSDDDVKLGQLVKSQGYRQDCLYSDSFIRVAWYDSLPEMLKGFEKNMFAFLNYSVTFVIIFTLLIIVLFYFPLIGLLFFNGIPFVLSLITVLTTIASFILIANCFNYPFYYGLFYPIMLGVDCYVSWRSLYLTLKNRGIYWRDTFYPLTTIKEKHLKTKF